MSVVVDASIILAVVAPDARQDDARRIVRGWLDSGEQLCAPALAYFEVANVLARRTFDGAIDLDEVADIWRGISDLGVIVHALEPAADGPAIAAVTARLRRRHASDAAYVCLAQRLGTRVWTLDAPLARNAAAAGLPVTLATSA